MKRELVNKFKFIGKKECDVKPVYMSFLSYIILSFVSSMMFWVFSLKKWILWGIYIPELDLAISDGFIFGMCIFGCETFGLIGAVTSFLVPTVTNAFVNIGIPILLIFALFNAEKDFGLMCIIVAVAFLFPTIWAVQQYLLSLKELDDKIYFYLCARIGVAILLLIGIFPFTVRNLFSEIRSDARQVQFSMEVMANREENHSFYYLNNLDQMWSSCSSEERFSALGELVEYECERLGISSVRLETWRREMVSMVSSYDANNDYIRIDIIQLKKASFDDMLSDVLRACRAKYQQDLMECMEKLEKAGKNIKAMPDFAWGYQLLEMERLDKEGKMGWETHYDITNADEEQWTKTEMQYLEKVFQWEI